MSCRHGKEKKKHSHQTSGVNGDEEKYALRNYISQFSKGLPHHLSNGLVRTHAYRSLLKAVKSGKSSDYEKIQVSPGLNVRLLNPQAAAFRGCDSRVCAFKSTPPTFESVEQGEEIIELYWMSLLRDAPFIWIASKPPKNDDDPYHVNELISLATSELSVSRHQLFRSFARSVPGVEIGPFISQFLLRPTKMGAVLFDGKIEVPFSIDYLTTWPEFIENQNGKTSVLYKVVQGRRYIATPRDLAHFVDEEVPYQAALRAALILLDLKVPLAKENPYSQLSGAPGLEGPILKKEIGYVTLGNSDLFSLLAEVSNLALKCAWYHKWNVHRRLRPEEYAGCIDRKLSGLDVDNLFPISEKVLHSDAVLRVFEKYSSHLLPQAYPSGAPLDPSFPNGHAVAAGAAVTILKAWFDETFLIPDPVQATSDGNYLIDYEPSASEQVMTVGGELNKLAFNIGVGREMAGVNFRSDTLQGLRLGEQVAISVLKTQKHRYNEPISGWSFFNFDGKYVGI